MSMKNNAVKSKPSSGSRFGSLQRSSNPLADAIKC